MKIITINPLTDPLWKQLVEEKRSDVFLSPKWLNVLAQTYDFTVQALVLVDGNNAPLAGVPYIKIDDMLSARIACLPFSDYCDPIVENSTDWEKLCSELISMQCPVTIRCLHNNAPLEDGRFKIIKQAKWHGLKLNDDIEALYRGFHGSSRRAIRKAQKAGISVRIAKCEEDLRAFYDLHLKTRKEKYRLLAQSFGFMKNIWGNFVDSGDGFLMLAEHKGKIVSGVYYIEWKGRLYYKFNASSAEHQYLRPNDLLMWEGIKYAVRSGLDYLDLGLSDSDQEGLIRYKRKYTNEEKTISFLMNSPADSANRRDFQIRNLLGKLTDLFTDKTVPDDISEKAGELLYRFFL